MFEKLYPSKAFSSAYEIDFEAYYRQGYRGIITDIDNTLVPHGAPADARSVALIHRLQEIGYEICLLSNNGEERVKLFNRELHLHYIFDGGKPARAGYQKAMELMGTDEENTLFLGDQIFTDVWGANRSGIYSLRVAPMDPKEDFHIILKRIPEKFIMAMYQRKLKKENSQLCE